MAGPAAPLLPPLNTPLTNDVACLLSTEWHSISVATSRHDNCRTDRRKPRRLSAPQPSAVDHRSQKDLQLWRYTTSTLPYAVSLHPV